MNANHLFWNKTALPLGVLIFLLGAATDFSRAQTTNSETTNSASEAPPAIPVLQIQADKVTAHVSPTLYGLMTEEINFSYEGGIYGELIRNRTFKANPTNAVYWDIINDTKISLDTNQPLNAALNVSLKMDTSTAVKNHTVGIVNNGYWGISVRPNSTYHLSFYAKGENFNGPLEVSLIHIGSTNVVKITDGSTISLDTNTMQISASTVKAGASESYMADQWQLAGAEISKISKDWQKYEVTLKTGDIKPTKDNRLMISAYKGGSSFWHRHSAVWFQQVSLFPPTFNNRPNGNRPDIMQLLADMSPKFLRLPGGNYLEGDYINERFDWKKTIGDISQRPGHRSPWDYWSTDGFGLLEYLDWCEDLHMEPLLAVYAGYSLKHDYVKPGPDLEPYVQDALDEIEYITGDASTAWGAQRAKDGHPVPFPLHYVEIGNEDWFDRSGSYDGRFTQFYDAIKAKYPNLQLISTVGNDHPQSMHVHSRTPDLVDEHFYKNQEQMEAQSHMYDNRPRTGPKVFDGEWATRVGRPTPNMAGALGDAAWMTGMERNSDLVLMESYAPLFVNVSDLGKNGSMQWPSDLIGYDALTSYGSPSYYAQVMFSNNHGDQVLAVDSENIPTYPQRPSQKVPSLFFDATRDSQSGIIFLKVVNHLGTPQTVHIKISGLNDASIKYEGMSVVLKAKNPDDTNSIQEPMKVVPVTEIVDGLGADFMRDFPPYSITILELKTN
jgi:alpha-N-arabinofuranosidase